MKRFFKFLKFCIGFGRPSTKQIEELVSREVQELDTLKKSVEEMRIIHKKVSEKISQNRAEEIEVIHEDVNYKNIVKPKEKRLSKDEIIKLEEYFGSHIGATARCYLYHTMLTPKYYPTLSKLLTAQSSTVEKIIWGRLLDKGLSNGMRKAMGVDDASAQKSLEAIREAFDSVSKRLRLEEKGKEGKKKFLMARHDGREVEHGEEVGFTAADLAFAALSSIIIMPPELYCFMPVKDEELPRELLALRDELRLTLAGQHVLEMYKNVRGEVVPKVVNRNCLPWGIITIGTCVGAGMVYAKL